METLFAEQQSTMAFPKRLTEEFRPRRVSEFIGLSKQKKVLSSLLHSPRACSLLFVGEPGTGKTTIAMAFAAELEAELHHVPSQQCNLETLQGIIAQCHRVAFNFTTGKAARFHVVLIDEADCCSDAAQKYLLSKMDSTNAPPQTIFIFTANSVDRLEERFLSRTLRLDFTSYGSGSEITELLERIWTAKAPANAERPVFKRLACGNVRQSLQNLELELLSA
jgi:replication-associated recombination protein RarA